jgi:hypothetical protein
MEQAARAACFAGGVSHLLGLAPSSGSAAFPRGRLHPAAPRGSLQVRLHFPYPSPAPEGGIICTAITKNLNFYSCTFCIA